MDQVSSGFSKIQRFYRHWGGGGGAKSPPRLSELKKSPPGIGLRCSYVIFSYININSIRNKLDNLQSIINNTVDVLALAESKIDNSFPSSQFNLKGYKKPYRLDINMSIMISHRVNQNT